MRPQWEIVLLYLFEIKAFDVVQPPLGATQRGISKGVEIPVPHIPRIMATLINEGLIVQRKVHHRGVDRRLITYSLTEKGIIRAREVMKGLLDEEIELNGKAIKLSQVRTLYPDYSGPLSSILHRYYKGKKVVSTNLGMEEVGNIPQWYAMLREKDLKKIGPGEIVKVDSWEVPYISILISKKKGYSLSTKGNMYLLSGEGGRVIVGDKNTKMEGEATVIVLDSLNEEDWERAFPPSKDFIKALYRISKGDASILVKLDDKAKEVKKCLQANPPWDCALKFFLDHRPS